MWTVFTGDNIPDPNAVVNFVTQRQLIAGKVNVAYERVAADVDWSLEGVDGDVVAYRIVEDV